MGWLVGSVGKSALGAFPPDCPTSVCLLRVQPVALGRACELGPLCSAEACVRSAAAARMRGWRSATKLAHSAGETRVNNGRERSASAASTRALAEQGPTPVEFMSRVLGRRAFSKLFFAITRAGDLCNDRLRQMPKSFCSPNALRVCHAWLCAMCLSCSDSKSAVGALGPASGQPALEQLQCSEVQVFPKVQGTEATQRWRKPGVELRLARFEKSYVLTAPEGTTVGRSLPTNDYVPEQRETLAQVRQLSFNTSQYVVRCMPDPIDPPS
jgi:hypothetical protein